MLLMNTMENMTSASSIIYYDINPYRRTCEYQQEKAELAHLSPWPIPPLPRLRRL